jgi:hypothetical protein
MLALATGLAAVVLWTLLLIRVALAVVRGKERRMHLLSMPIVGVIASMGTFASALAYASGHGFDIGLDAQLLTLLASMGRGGLGMGALLALGYYHPK